MRGRRDLYRRLDMAADDTVDYETVEAYYGQFE
jgi:hypothetical protein